jgi:mannose-6-phosphate isomerase-like protein (cupin superfamily)
MDAEPLAGKTIGTTDGTFVVAEWRDDGQSSRELPVAPVHLHRGEDEAWYVLEGKLGFRIADEEVEASAGAAVLVPHATPHTYWNAAGRTARYVLVMGPLTARLVQAIHAAEDRSPERMRELFREYGSELL